MHPTAHGRKGERGREEDGKRLVQKGTESTGKVGG